MSAVTDAPGSAGWDFLPAIFACTFSTAPWGMPDYLEIRAPAGLTVLPVGDVALVIGRDPAGQIVCDGDTLVSRRHAVLEPLPGGWRVSDLGSRNGTRVNGDLVVGSRALRDGDEIAVGASRLVLHCEVGSGGDTTRTAEAPPVLTRREQDVLIALLRPARAGGVFTEPASTREIAKALFVTEAAVKQHLTHLFAKFGIGEGERRRVRLANEALRRGAVRLSELRGSRE